MNNPSEAYYQLRYDFTLHYLFVVHIPMHILQIEIYKTFKEI